MRNAAGYTWRMTIQIAVKVPDEVMRRVDELVAKGEYESRSEAVRAGLSLVTSAARRREIDRAFAYGFARVPDSAAEIADAHRQGVESIEDEPWEKWW